MADQPKELNEIRSVIASLSDDELAELAARVFVAVLTGEITEEVAELIERYPFIDRCVK